jgi:hypothetical protein
VWARPTGHYTDRQVTSRKEKEEPAQNFGVKLRTPRLKALIKQWDDYGKVSEMILRIWSACVVSVSGCIGIGDGGPT